MAQMQAMHDTPGHESPSIASRLKGRGVKESDVLIHSVTNMSVLNHSLLCQLRVLTASQVCGQRYVRNRAHGPLLLHLTT